VLGIFLKRAAEGKPAAETYGRMNLGLQAVLMLVVGAVGLSSLLGNGPVPGGWLEAKLLGLAIIFGMSIGIDFAFRPVLPAFMRLASEGSSPIPSRVRRPRG